jgi:hypothetical protein
MEAGTRRVCLVPPADCFDHRKHFLATLIDLISTSENPSTEGLL